MVKQTQETVVELLSGQLDIDPQRVTPEANIIKDLGADSLDVVQLMIEMEASFDLDIPLEDVEKLQTVADVVSFIDLLRTA